MFVLKSKYDALKREAEANERSARFVLNQYRQREDNMERELRRVQSAYRHVKQELNKAHEENARLADLQKPERGAGAQAFDNIVRVVSHKRSRAVYEGHAGEGGIQHHSIGEEYPFIVYAEEFRGCLRWRIMDSRSGHTLVDKYGYAENASSRARGLKKYDLRINAQGHAYHKE